MVTEELEKELEQAVEKGLREIPREPIPMRGAQLDLAAAVQQHERIRLELEKRLRRAAVEARIEAEHKIGLANADFDRQLSEETARLERERAEMIRQANDELNKKLHDLAGLARRQQA